MMLVLIHGSAVDLVRFIIDAFLSLPTNRRNDEREPMRPERERGRSSEKGTCRV
jgi:hypothetical protein